MDLIEVQLEAVSKRRSLWRRILSLLDHVFVFIEGSFLEVRNLAGRLLGISFVFSSSRVWGDHDLEFISIEFVKCASQRARNITLS